MTAPNPAATAQPGWRGTDPDGGTWVRRHMDYVIPWSMFDAYGMHHERSQEEAEAAGLVPLIPTWSEALRSRFAGRPYLTITDLKFEPAPLDPGNPEHRDLVADFLSLVADEVNGSAFHHVRETQGVLRSGAVTLRHKIAAAEQDGADRKRAEEYAGTRWEFDTTNYWECVDEHLAGIRAERARQEAGQ
ncbi:hypothetical protein TSOC111612_12045 [Tsukamurella ocularis]|uniref:hypothetical protein n=1 Tax=Tsukamurella ocularis TaxID=1970234 RepID=UPI0039EE1B5F